MIKNTTATYLSVLGLRPWLGRWFTPEEDTRGAPVVGVLGHHTWRSRFGADPTVIGRTIRIDGVPVMIVGVGPAGHNGTLNTGIVTDFWLPIGHPVSRAAYAPTARQATHQTAVLCRQIQRCRLIRWSAFLVPKTTALNLLFQSVEGVTRDAFRQGISRPLRGEACQNREAAS